MRGRKNFGQNRNFGNKSNFNDKNELFSHQRVNEPILASSRTVAIFDASKQLQPSDIKFKYQKRAESPFLFKGKMKNQPKIYFIDVPSKDLDVGFVKIMNKTVIVCPIIHPRCFTLIRMVQRVIDERIHVFDKGLIDLSNISSIFPKYDMNLDFEFTLFLFGVYCLENDLTDKVTAVDMSNNGVTKPDMFILIQMYFPKITSILQGHTNILHPGQYPPRQAGQHEQTFFREGFFSEEMRPTSWFGLEGQMINQHPGNPPNLIAHHETPINEIGALAPEQMSEYPTTPFVVNLFRAQSTDFSNSQDFYSPTALFSLTVEHSSSELSDLLPFSRNLFDEGENEKVCEGPDEIQELLDNIFSDGIQCSPQNMVTHVLSEGLYAVIVNGICNFGGERNYSFERSMIIGIEGETILITNDHYFFSLYKETENGYE